MSVDTQIVDSYIQLTNYFAANYGSNTEMIGSLRDLWQKQGSMISQMMQCDTKAFSSSDLFYEVIHRKIRLMNGSFAEALDPRKAATGDALEICKFFALYLEFLRKDYSGMLTEYLEKLAAQSGFNSTVVLDIFAFFDSLYETVDHWWECLTRVSDQDPESSSGFRTPRQNSSFTSFTTPTATARRLRTATSAARRSPIAEAVDSPTMRCKRIGLELKQAKNRVRETEQHVEDLENENRQLKDENRKYKITIDDLKSNVTAKRESAEDAEQRSQDLAAQLEESQREQASLARQLEESRNAVRTQQRLLEELEAEKDKLATKSAKNQEDLEKCLKDLRKTRDKNEQEFERYRKKERELTDLVNKSNENANLLEHLTSLEAVKSELYAKNYMMRRKIEELTMLNSHRTITDAKLPLISMPSISRRSDESLSDFEREFNNRVMDIFTRNRQLDFEEFKIDTENFLKSLRAELFLVEGDERKFVTLKILSDNLKTSPQSIGALLPHNIVSTFLKITNFNLTIDIALIEELVSTIIHVEETYIKLLRYAENSTKISSYRLQDFIAAHYVPTMIEVPERSKYYSAYAVGIIFFLLGARRREHVFIKDLLSSTLLMHLETCIQAENNCLPMPEVDVFTVAQFRATLHEFRCLDTDRNGVLSSEELSFFRDGTFNIMFLQRVFDISMTYEGGCIDFKAFVDLMCAIRFRHTRASAKYHFEAFDLKNDGILDEEEIRSTAGFQDPVLPEYVPGKNNVHIDIVAAELKDMLRLKKTGITLEEFIENRMNATFSGFLSNYADYLKYERREQ